MTRFVPSLAPFIARLLPAAALALAVAACSRPQVQTSIVAPATPLPAPTRVVVTDFAVAPDQIRLDSGIAAALRRQQSGVPDSTLQAEVASEVQDALGDTLTKRLVSYGLPAERAAPGAPLGPGTLLISGQILSVDQGNRTRRLLIGLGAGKSSLAADTQVYYVGADGTQRLVQSATGSVDSGRAPGAAETMGAGAAAQTLGRSAALTVASHGMAESRRTPAGDLADSLGGAVARKVGLFAQSQGWITPGTVK